MEISCVRERARDLDLERLINDQKPSLCLQASKEKGTKLKAKAGPSPQEAVGPNSGLSCQYKLST